MRKGLRFKLSVMYVVSIVLPLLAMGVILPLYFQGVNDRINGQGIQNTLYSASENIRNYLEELKRTSLSPNVYPSIMAFYEQANDGEQDGSYQSYKIKAEYRMLMQRLLTLSRQDIRGVAFIPMRDPHATYMVDTITGKLYTSDAYDFLEKPWFAEVIRGGGAPVLAVSPASEYYSSVNPDTGLVIEQPRFLFSVMRLVKDPLYSRAVGVIKVDASADVIEEGLQKLVTSPRSGLVLLDGGDSIVYTTRPELSALVVGLPRDRTPIDIDNYTCYSQPIQGTGWRLLYVLSRRDMQAQSQAVFLMCAGVALGCLLVSFAIYSFYSRRVTAPVNSIIQTIRQTEQGDLSARTRLTSDMDKDLSLIATELNNMIEKLDAHIRSEYKAVISQKNAEYLALQTQISPHFLYNTLNGFITLNRLGEKKALEDSILQLTKLFRYTCSNQNTAMLGQELEFIGQYLALQQLRFDDRLKFGMWVDERVQDLLIPRLLIQPLVENAVIHGMEPSSEPFELMIQAFPFEHPQLGPFVQIQVMDSGVGFDERNTRGQTRVGLGNVIERLELFDKGATFSVKSLPGFGTACFILIPDHRRARP